MDGEILRRNEIFEGMDDSQVSRLAAVAQPRRLRPGECLFLMGERAEHLYIVVGGKIELTFPFSFGGTMRDICVESKLPGSALGWSALVKPYRFTLSARAAESSEVTSFARQDLSQVFDANPQTGYLFTKAVSAIVGRRLLHVQALWAREFQKAITTSLEVPKGPGDMDDSHDQEDWNGIGR